MDKRAIARVARQYQAEMEMVYKKPCSQCGKEVRNGWHFNSSREQWGQTGDGIGFFKSAKFCHECKDEQEKAASH